MKFNRFAVFLFSMSLLTMVTMSTIAFRTYEPLHITAFAVCSALGAVSLILTLLDARWNERHPGRQQDDFSIVYSLVSPLIGGAGLLITYILSRNIVFLVVAIAAFVLFCVLTAIVIYKSKKERLKKEPREKQ
jgi:dipeptide/tripeptide permease